MNVSELARKLKVSPAVLLEQLPRMGFDVGKKAIKIDDRIAQTIVRKWSAFMRESEQKAKAEKKQAMIAEAISTSKELELPPYITVRELSNALHLSIPVLMTELMKSGILASVNERIDFETAAVVAEDLGFTVKGVAAGEASGEGTTGASEKLKEALKGSTTIQARPPVVVVMGHVDHGKTTLLDAIRRTEVAAGEAGGITQHIGAYQVEHDGKLLTFIDTPGHEAFRAMRSRGAKVADVAILVVAADDGMKPQTKEALTIIQGVGLPFLVAINKIDKEGANIERVKKELAEMNVLPEDWGGKIACVPISAKAGQNIDQLLETVLLVAELNAETIVADASASALGTVIEAHVDRGEGPVATLLVQNGTLRQGESLVHGDMMLGKVRVLRNHNFEPVEVAGPSTPVQIVGLKSAPEVGDILEVGDPNTDYKAPEKRRLKRTTGDITVTSEETEGTQQIVVPIIVKADMLGSLEAIIESVAKLEHPEVRVQIIGKGLGNITESDILRAAATTEALVAGFHVQVSREARDLADEQKVEIKAYDVIYDFLDDVKARMSSKLVPEIVRSMLGQATVLAIFKQEPKHQIVGVKITGGMVQTGMKAHILRKKESLGETMVETVRSGKETIREAVEGTECGLGLAGEVLVEVGDTIEFYREEEQRRSVI